MVYGQNRPTMTSILCVCRLEADGSGCKTLPELECYNELRKTPRAGAFRNSIVEHFNRSRIARQGQTPVRATPICEKVTVSARRLTQ